MISATHLYAMIVYFPIALLLVGFLFEVIGLIRKSSFFMQASFYLLLLAAAGAITAYLTGDAAGDGMAMEAHEQAAMITLLLKIAAVLAQLTLVLIKMSIPWLKME